MKDTPILMCGEMVLATMEDRKTQTRRVAMLPDDVQVNSAGVYTTRWDEEERHGWRRDYWCPYGKPGDRLWVKETHWRFGRWVEDGLTEKGRPRWRFRAYPLHSAAFTDPHHKPKRTEKGWHKRPSIFMPRSCSRITLEITEVRVQRLQDISEEDAWLEGVAPRRQTTTPPIDYGRERFQALWDSINAKRAEGKYAWACNPWVWAITFKRL